VLLKSYEVQEEAVVDVHEVQEEEVVATWTNPPWMGQGG
jgi:hypothetical protein